MSTDFDYDILLSHSAKNKAVVRPLAERLQKDGLRVWPVPPERPCEGGFDEWMVKPSDSIPAKIDPPSLRSYGGIEEGLEHSRVLACPAVALGRRRMLCMSANAFGSDWAQLACPAIASPRRRKAGTFRFRDPLDNKRRFIPVGLENPTVLKAKAGAFACSRLILWRRALPSSNNFANCDRRLSAATHLRHAGEIAEYRRTLSGSRATQP